MNSTYDKRLKVPPVRDVGGLHIIFGQGAEENVRQGEAGAVGQGLHADVGVLNISPQDLSRSPAQWTILTKP